MGKIFPKIAAFVAIAATLYVLVLADSLLAASDESFGKITTRAKVQEAFGLKSAHSYPFYQIANTKKGRLELAKKRGSFFFTRESFTQRHFIVNFKHGRKIHRMKFSWKYVKINQRVDVVRSRIKVNMGDIKSKIPSPPEAGIKLEKQFGFLPLFRQKVTDQEARRAHIRRLKQIREPGYYVKTPLNRARATLYLNTEDYAKLQSSLKPKKRTSACERAEVRGYKCRQKCRPFYLCLAQISQSSSEPNSVIHCWEAFHHGSIS